MTTDRVILEELAAIHPRLAPELGLQAWVNGRVLQPLTLGELRLKLEALERKELTTAVRDEISGARKWTITNQGRAALQSE